MARREYYATFPLVEIQQTFRLHGVTGYRHRHTAEELGAIAERLAPDAPNSVLFNNRCMAEDARRFPALVRAHSLPRA